MAVSYINGNSAEGDASVTSITSTALSVNAGDLIILSVSDRSNTTTLTCSDSAGNTYTSRIGPISANNSSFRVRTFSAIAAGSASITFTGTRSASGGAAMAVSVAVFRSTIGSGWVFDNSSSGIGTDNSGGGTRSVTSFAVAAGNVVVAGTHGADRVTATTAAGTNYTLAAASVSTTQLLAINYKTNFTGGSNQTTPFTTATAERWVVTAVSFKEQVGGNTFNQSAAGTLSFTGVLKRKTIIKKTGALSFTGVLTKAKKTIKILTATLRFTGVVSKSKTVLKILTAALSFAGSLKRRANKKVTGSVSFTGVLRKRVGKKLTASLTFIGLLRKNISKKLTSSLNFIGLLHKRTGKNLAASLSFTGVLHKTVNKYLSGVANFTGLLTTTRFFNRLLTGTLSFTGSLSTSFLHIVQHCINGVGRVYNRISVSSFAVHNKISGSGQLYSRIATVSRRAYNRTSGIRRIFNKIMGNSQ